MIDRGIHQATEAQVWQIICDAITLKLKEKHYRKAVIDGVSEIGQVLNQFYNQQMSENENELTNSPIILN